MKDGETIRHESSDFGTPEARRHMKVRLEPRGVSNGGRVVTVGITNVISDLLESLYDGGHLRHVHEPQNFADSRVANGRAFQELYQFFRSRGKDLAAAEMVYRMMPTLEGHIGSERDIAETVYNEVLRGLREKGAIIHAICIEGSLKDSIASIRGALDALPRCMEAARDLVTRRLK